MLKIWARSRPGHDQSASRTIRNATDRKRGGQGVSWDLARRSWDGVQSICWRAPGGRCGLGDAAWGLRASFAADMPVKAPPPAVRADLDVHGFFDRLVQERLHHAARSAGDEYRPDHASALAGLALDVYKNKAGFINSVSVYGDVWNDLWSEQNHPHGRLVERVRLGRRHDREVRAELEVRRRICRVPAARPATSSIERNVEFTLAYDDSTGGAAAVHDQSLRQAVLRAPPARRRSCSARRGGTYDVELGIVPTFDLQEDHRHSADGLGADLGHRRSAELLERRQQPLRHACARAATDNAGVFSTGLTGKLALNWIPSRLGTWYVKGGFQYYHIINDNLLLAQTLRRQRRATVRHRSQRRRGRLRRRRLQLLRSPTPRGGG